MRNEEIENLVYSKEEQNTKCGGSTEKWMWHVIRGEKNINDRFLRHS